MLTVTSQQLHQNTDHIQAIANHQPVFIKDDSNEQVLISYDDYLKLGGEKSKNFVSLYDSLFLNMSPELYQTLSHLDTDDLED